MNNQLQQQKEILERQLKEGYHANVELSKECQRLKNEQKDVYQCLSRHRSNEDSMNFAIKELTNEIH